MTDTIYIGSESGTWFALAVFLGISAAIGYTLYVLLTCPGSRRIPFRSLSSVSRISGGVIAVVGGGAIFVLICSSMLTGFSRIEADGEMLRLRYLLPPRTVPIRRDQLKLLERKYAHKVFWRLAITTQDGRTYESLVTSSRAVEDARLGLAQLASE